MARLFRRIAESSPRLPIDPDLAAPRASRAPRATPIVDLALVGLGGSLGTLARYECAQTWPDRTGRFPLTIFLVNVSGALVIGALLTWLSRAGRMDSPRLFWSVGVLGGWTTMSSFAIGFDELFAHHRLATALLYAASTVAGGAVATAVGISVASRLPRVTPR